MTLLERAAAAVPEPAKPTARKWFYVLYPKVSWRKRRRVDDTTDAFVDRFFDDEAEYYDLREEFFDGRIVDICVQGDRTLPEDESVYDAHRDECAKLYALVRKREPDTVVETGVYHGVSTAAILLALDANDRGGLHSIDAATVVVDDYYGEFIRRERPTCAESGTHRLPDDRDPGWILPDDLREHWHLTTDRPHRALPDVLPEAGPVDLFLHDSLHSASGMLFEFELAWEWLSPGGLLASCHVGNNDALDTFAAEHDCERGLFSYDYNGLEGYDAPCSCGYAIKPEVAT